MKIPIVPAAFFGLIATLSAAPRDRIARPLDNAHTRTVPGSLHRLAQPQYDRGAVDPKTAMPWMVVHFKPSAEQQAELDRLLADQQNPSSKNFRQWLTPEDFGNRFGLSASDHSKVAAWLRAEGFTVNQSGRARNWIAFSGTAGQVAKSLHAPIHRFEVNGETHFANMADPAVPEALVDVVDGFIGLHDFQLRSMARVVEPAPGGPDNNIGTSHYLAPEDYSTIYDIAPLYQAGYDGTGQSIAVVGASDVLITDLRAFRTRYNLPANDPKLILYNGVDPGFNGAQLEGNLDLEWAGAIAPKATIYYVYGANPITAIVSAINLNVAPIVSISYGACEVDYAVPFYRSFAQQGNAQGITILSASGDSGAAGCEAQGALPFANQGQAVDFPAVMPEVTGVGGTQFVEGSGTYWAAANSANGGSALSYIPEAAWNESGIIGLLAGGGGASRLYARPAWQTGPGVPLDGARHVPDIALSAAGHDAYLVTYNGGLAAVSGTSASAPSMAGIVALLNQYQVTNKFQKAPGLGNINPQLYRLAQSAPTAFHDVALGGNAVPCAQASADCTTGTIGYAAGAAYDMATGLGSIDANTFVTQWNKSVNAVSVSVSAGAGATVNGTVQATVTVSAASGSGTPTGSVDFSMNGIVLGSVALSPAGAAQTAVIAFPLYRFSVGRYVLSAEYSGDASFSSGGGTAPIQILAPAGGTAGVLLSGPNTVWPQPVDAQGLSWQTAIVLREVGGVPAFITGFTMDGVAQPLATYFPSQDLPANGTLTVNVVLRNIAAPVTRSFVITGVDVGGNTFSRQLPVLFANLPTYDYFNFSVTPLTITQNPAADPSCQWAAQLNLDDEGGYLHLISALYAGGVDYSANITAIFGTTRLDALRGVQGKLCFAGITPPATDSIQILLSSGGTQSVTVAFAGPVAAPTKLTVAPASVSIAAAAGQSGSGSLALTTSNAAQPWTISVFPANRTTSWLTISQLSGVGNAQLVLKANAAGFEPGVYSATITIESDTSIPQITNVPVMFVIGGSSAMSVTGVGHAATGLTTASPGSLLAVFGINLARYTNSSSGSPLPYTIADNSQFFNGPNVSATVNGIAAPLLYASPTQVNIQIPLEASAGPAVVGINNNGLIAGTMFQIAPSAPGIFTDAAHNVLPATNVRAGSYATVYLTGAGDVTPALKTAYAPAATTLVAALPRPLLPLSVTIGGIQAFVQFAGLVRLSVGVTQVNFLVPPGTAPGAQPVVVTINGVASPAAILNVQAAAATGTN